MAAERFLWWLPVVAACGGCLSAPYVTAQLHMQKRRKKKRRRRGGEEEETREEHLLDDMYLIGSLLSIPQIKQLCERCHLATAAAVAQGHEVVVCLGASYLVQIIACSHPNRMSLVSRVNVGLHRRCSVKARLSKILRPALPTPPHPPPSPLPPPPSFLCIFRTLLIWLLLDAIRRVEAQAMPCIECPSRQIPVHLCSVKALRRVWSLLDSAATQTVSTELNHRRKKCTL